MSIIDYVRPSTLLRVVENTIEGIGYGVGYGVATSARYVGRKARRISHNVGVELTARAVARAQRRLERDTALVAGMSRAQLKQVSADQREILRRVDQLRRGRAG